jgi:ribosomal-protein-alanine N-acetyltransferase
MANNRNGLQTSRLTIFPLTLTQVLMYFSNDHLLEKSLRLKFDRPVLPKEFIDPIGQFVIPYITKFPQQLMFGTIWILIDRDQDIMVGDIGFKGAPTEKGVLEFGYGTHPGFEGKGYMTEAVQCMVGWAFSQSDVNIILAETDKTNLPSQKILNKNSFSIFAESDSAYWWRLDKTQTVDDEKIPN